MKKLLLVTFISIMSFSESHATDDDAVKIADICYRNSFNLLMDINNFAAEKANVPFSYALARHGGVFSIANEAINECVKKFNIKTADINTKSYCNMEKRFMSDLVPHNEEMWEECKYGECNKMRENAINSPSPSALVRNCDALPL